MLIYYILNLLSNTRSRNDTYGTIARQLSRNISKLDDYSLTALAEICSVSPASLSRFTRLMDYRNYSTMALHQDYCVTTGTIKKTRMIGSSSWQVVLRRPWRSARSVA